MSESSIKKNSKSDRKRAENIHSGKPTFTDALNNALTLRLREVALLVLLVLASISTIALLTYTRNDPGWNHVGFDQDVMNAAGVAGAWLASVLFSLFGVLAWMIPVVLFAKVAMVIRYRYQTWEWGGAIFFLRLFGLILALGSGAALAALFLPAVFLPTMFSLPHSTGGILGQVILQQFVPVFNALGSSLLLLPVFITGLTLYSEISWFRVIDLIGHFVIWFIAGCLNAIREGVIRLKG